MAPGILTDTAWCSDNFSLAAAKQPDASPSASRMEWNALSFPDASSYTIELTDAEVMEVEQALEHFLTLELDGEGACRQNFNLPTLREKLFNLAHELHECRGFFILRGLDPNKYTDEDNMLLFLGISSYIGHYRGQQTDDGKIFGHIRNAVALDVSQQERPIKDSARGSTFHNDIGCDILAMQARSNAASGGRHLIASGAKIFNELRATRPHLAEELTKPSWPMDICRQYAATETRPLFFPQDGRIISSVLPDCLLGLAGVERTAGLPRMTVAQIKAHNAVQELAEKNQVALDMQPGDLLFINNYGILHGREPFQDTEEQKRYLVRLWLKNEHLAWSLPASLQPANDMVFHGEQPAVWNIAPEARRKFQVYERQAP